MIAIKNILNPPVFEDEIKTQEAYLLNIILWVLVCVPIPFVIYTLTLNPENTVRTLAQTIFGETVNIVLLLVLHRGYVKVASAIQVGAFWIFFTATAMTGSGVQGESYLLGYGLVIVIAGLLHGGSGALIMTVLSLTVGGVMVYAQSQGMINAAFNTNPLTTWFVSVVLFPVTATLQYLGTRSTRQALGRARVSEARYRLISEASSDYTFSTALDENGKMYLNWVAGAFERITGYTFEEYTATGGWQGHLFPEDVDVDENAFGKLARNETAISEVRTLKKNGELSWVRVYANPVWNEREDRLSGIIGAVQDITEKKQAEEALRKSESIYRRAIEVAGAVPYHQTYDEKGGITYDFMGEGIREITGFGPDEFNDDLWDTLVQERHLLGELESFELEQAIEQVRGGNIPIWKCEHRIKARDGQIHWVFEAAVDLRDERGTAYGSVGLYQDITERKNLEEEEAKRRESLEKVVTIGKRVTEPNNLQLTLQKIWQSIRLELGFDRVGIYLYNPEFGRMDGTYGTNNNGEMVDEWDDHKSLSDNSLETKTFLKVLKEPDGYYFTHHYNQDHDIKTNLVMSEVNDYAAVAAWAGTKPVAVLCVDNAITQKPITNNQLESLLLFAGFAGLAIENERLHSALETELEQQKQNEEREVQRRTMLEKVVILGKYVTQAADLRTTLERIWHGIHDDLGFDRLGIFLYNAERQSMDDTLGTNLQGEMVDEWDIWFPITEAAIFMRVLERPDGLYFTHNYDVENNIPEGNEMFGVKDYAAVAAWAGDKPVAVICVDQLLTQRRITDPQLEALQLFAGYAGLAIENSRLNEALKRELDVQKEAEENEASRRAMLERVIHLGQSVTEVKNLKTTIESIWHGVHDIIGFDRLAIFLYDQETNTVNGTLGTDNDGNIVEEWDYQRTLNHEKPTSFMRALEKPNGLFYTDNFGVEFDIPEGHDMYHVKDFASVAAWAGDKPVAIITVDNHPSGRPFMPAQLEALRLFGGYAGLAIQNSKLNTALQVELDQRQTFINELENKNAELERFTYTVSHDLKSPLVTITGFLGFLEMDALRGNKDRVKNSINRIAAAAKKMQKLLNDLLELSRIGRIMNAPEDIPFEEIVHDAIDHVRGLLDEADAVIEIEREFPAVHGDRVRLVEVVQNLIENAVKYANTEVQLRIELGTSGQNEKGCPIFFVRDNGIGIEPEYHELIFGLFNKLDAQSEGTGIGLSLVKRIIEVHNGRIWVESEKGKGATFYFALPTPKPKE